MNGKKAKMLRRQAEKLTVGLCEGKTREVYKKLKKEYARTSF